jgi:hypothetical protein
LQHKRAFTFRDSFEFKFYEIKITFESFGALKVHHFQLEFMQKWGIRKSLFYLRELWL